MKAQTDGKESSRLNILGYFLSLNSNTCCHCQKTYLIMTTDIIA